MRGTGLHFTHGDFGTRPGCGKHASKAAPLWNFLLDWSFARQLGRAAAQRQERVLACLPAGPAPLLLSLDMAATGARMRLTVVVEALAEENAHGEYRDMALAAFKERKFAMPVQLDNTFETVWNDIETRYKTNYLSAQQAATFSIKKLQDAYDCDLDMTDTVGAIFEGEPDRKMHMIKVVPHFIFRETSVVPGSMLRPAAAQKRMGDDMEVDDDSTNKRRRIGSQQPNDTQDTRAPSPNRPIPSTEIQRVAAEDMETDVRSSRSRSGLSLIELSRTETGQAPFGSDLVKQESPEPADTSLLHISTSGEQAHPVPEPTTDEVPAIEDDIIADTQTALLGHTQPLQRNSLESAIHKSPVSPVEQVPEPEMQTTSTHARALKSRRDVYRVPSSPEFMQVKATPEKPARTYGRSPRSGADFLNKARKLGTTAIGTTATQTSAFIPESNLRPHLHGAPVAVESTPKERSVSGPADRRTATTNDDNDNDDDLTASFLHDAAEAASSTSLSTRKQTAKPPKPGSLKKPSRASLTASPISANLGAKAKLAATPTSTKLANKSSLPGTISTPVRTGQSESTKSPNGNSMSRMERLQMMLSQSTPKRNPNGEPTGRRSTTRSKGQSNRSSPEVRVSGAKKVAPAGSETEIADVPRSAQDAEMRTATKISPVPLPSVRAKVSTPVSLADTGNHSPVPNQDSFRKPAPKAPKSPRQPPGMQRNSTTPTASAPRRSEIPLPPNVRHLRRSSSLQRSPLASSDNTASQADPNESVVKARSNSKRLSVEDGNVDAVKLPSPAITKNSATCDSSAESPTFDARPDASEVRHTQVTKGLTDMACDKANAPSSLQRSARHDDFSTPSLVASNDNTPADTTKNKLRTVAEQQQPNNAPVTPAHAEVGPPSGQGSVEAVPWNAGSWNFGGPHKAAYTNNKREEDHGNQAHIASKSAHASEDEGFAEQETYSTAVEDNVARSRSSSAAASVRSSPAVSRQPARFLSHSPTPDTSESEDDSDGASAVASRTALLHANGKDETESESDTSSDSSDDEDEEIPNLHAEQSNDSNANAAPPSSPPQKGHMGSTPIIPATSQVTPSRTNGLTQRTPLPPPTQQSSQAPRSSQSISVQAADRRRYTGFRSLREQLADTKAAQATTQKKAFDPRTMNLGKLAKGKPLVGTGGDDSSDDESSSSSDSDSDSD